MIEIELKPYPNNPRFITDDAKEKLGKSMLEFGDLSGIVLNQADGYLISGHQRVQSLIERYGKYEVNIIEGSEKTEYRGFVEPEHIAFRLVNWNDGKASAARLAANKHGGEWEQEKLDKELQKLQDMGIDLDLTGFEITEDIDYNAIYQGMPEFENEDQESYRKIIVHFDSDEDAEMFGVAIKQKITDKTKYIWFPQKEEEKQQDKKYEN